MYPTYYDNFVTYSFAVSVNKIYDLEILISSNDLPVLYQKYAKILNYFDKL